ncbi:Tetraacyldisaccharide 4'-kinase [Candidatus Profftia lariciata]|uniref:tetraacyldisaccharide 4'-kinase n=1 Tax=Candidatus Profftia lariciata TaxID=1987921 RepID=UPI001D01512F|nr:tetraacyldisaccharide 4'-kinase [Candidatus Profftia lariciata]UDG81468.1 Tetraacyldisaccharide 4'-kinase [Candidatus Profftia lariciata]
MIERIWFGKSCIYLFLLPFSFLYGLISCIRKFCYRVSWLQSWRAPCPVIVVGNLTVGGSGKTPIVIWLVEQLQAKGLRIGVVSRGYGGYSEHYPILLNKNTSTDQAGDEPVLIYQRTHAIVAVAPKRSDAVKAICKNSTVDIIITDDGLQHYALARDMELVLIDGMRRFGNGWWLPAGPMRERTGRLRSVDAVIVNGGQTMIGEIPMRIIGHTIINIKTGERCIANSFKNVVAIAGIGNPANFFSMLRYLGIVIIKSISFTDHYKYNFTILKNLTPENEQLIMTEKDAVKCRIFAQSNWWYLPVSAMIPDDKANELLTKITKLLIENH